MSAIAPVAAIRDRLGGDEAAAVTRLLAKVAAVDGPAGIDDDTRTALAGDGRADVSACIVTADAEVAAYAQLARSGRTWTVETAVDPAAQVPGSPVSDLLGRCVRDHIEAAGGGDVALWLSQPRPVDERLAAAIGVTASRSLYQVRRPLPVESEISGRSEALATRPFRPGHDEEAWLKVNNRAFSWHPEQGGWTVADVVDHQTQPWFDADGFLLHEIDGRLAGFCWTKVHTDVDPVQGEIYVIAVDPDFGGQGLGRRLVLAGLAHLAELGISVGMLYVDASNIGAVKLYADLGFEVDHVNVLHTTSVKP